jgi:hypothetical protein
MWAAPDYSIVIAALYDFENLLGAFSIHSIDKAMFAGDAARPPSGKIMFKGFGLADPLKRTASYLFDEALAACSIF